MSSGVKSSPKSSLLAIGAGLPGIIGALKLERCPVSEPERDLYDDKRLMDELQVALFGWLGCFCGGGWCGGGGRSLESEWSESEDRLGCWREGRLREE